MGGDVTRGARWLGPGVSAGGGGATTVSAYYAPKYSGRPELGGVFHAPGPPVGPLRPNPWRKRCPLRREAAGCGPLSTFVLRRRNTVFSLCECLTEIRQLVKANDARWRAKYSIDLWYPA